MVGVLRLSRLPLGFWLLLVGSSRIGRKGGLYLVSAMLASGWIQSNFPGCFWLVPFLESEPTLLAFCSPQFRFSQKCEGYLAGGGAFRVCFGDDQRGPSGKEGRGYNFLQFSVDILRVISDTGPMPWDVAYKVVASSSGGGPGSCQFGSIFSVLLFLTCFSCMNGVSLPHYFP